ncbi:uncharacterized protein TEOVI_000225200 [Trypanosoma equiperdum]|uniref:Uncharacterized protein n=2 Tax=Trypanozoon TaxID=39700 RepID=Q4GYK8_TRYB2|nr:hypothetical protein, unlikely [Trypanosoma brucei brucei TREU927]CAJ16576.1 hypothetical protein, unlikely [Trypanosoma brucei brucei TREU927]SCU70678.1 hypothetical protein, conserved [Trypanosoma equiperdum]
MKKKGCHSDRKHCQKHVQAELCLFILHSVLRKCPNKMVHSILQNSHGNIRKKFEISLKHETSTPAPQKRRREVLLKRKTNSKRGNRA